MTEDTNKVVSELKREILGMKIEVIHHLKGMVEDALFADDPKQTRTITSTLIEIEDSITLATEDSEIKSALTKMVNNAVNDC